MNRLVDAMPKAADALGLSTSNFLILAVCLVVLFIGPWIRIFRRAGFNPGLGFLMFIPIINVLLFLLFAFFEWPIERENRVNSESPLWRA